VLDAAGYHIGEGLGAYVGIATLLAAVGSLVFLGRSRPARALWCVLVLSVGLSISPPLVKAAYKLVPFISYSQISRVSAITCFAIASLGGLGLSLASRSPDLRTRRIFVLVVAAAVVLVGVLYLVLVLQGRHLADWFVGVAAGLRQDSPDAARAINIGAWLEGDGAGWLAYEKRVIAKTLGFAAGTLVLIGGLVLAGGGRRRLRLCTAGAVLLVVAIDLFAVSRAPYVRHPAAGFRTVPGIETLKQMVGALGRWRTKAFEGKREVLMVNSNEIFGIASLGGRCTIVPREVRGFSQGLTLDGPRFRPKLSGADPGVTAIDALMSVRFVLTDGLETRFLAPSLAAAIARDADLARHLRMFEAGGESRFSFVSAVGESLVFTLDLPAARFLDFEIASSAGSVGGEPLRFKLTYESGERKAAFEQVIEEGARPAGWTACRLDLSELGSARGRITMSAVPVNPGGEWDVEAAWSSLEFVTDTCEVRPSGQGYQVAGAGAGRTVNLHLTSDAREIPLEIDFEGAAPRTRWIMFPANMKHRQVPVVIPVGTGPSIRLRSDSTFTILGAKLVALAFPHRPDLGLMYDADMNIYENFAAVSRGICVRKDAIKVGAADGGSVLDLGDPEALPALRCGTCSVVRYEGEEVLLDVSASQDCYLVFQDTYYPGWTVRVDGAEREILRTNIGIRAIEIPRGEHRVTMRFAPASLKLGLGLTLVGIILAIIYWRVGLHGEKSCCAVRPRR
jgi:hypothetical protein